MDETLPDDKAITAPVPTVMITTEDKYTTFPVAEISHFVVQLSDRSFDSIMQSIAGVSYNVDKPWAFWFFIGKIISKSFFGSEERLEWLDSVRFRDREFIAFTNTSSSSVQNENVQSQEILPPAKGSEKGKLQVVEVDFSRSRTGRDLRLFWKPARGIVRRKVEGRM